MKLILETQRLKLSHFTLDDLNELVSLLSDKNVMRYYPKMQTTEETKKHIERVLEEYKSGQPSFWKVQFKSDGEFAGQAGILYREVAGKMEYMLGYMIRKKFWGLGLAPEISSAILEYGYKKLGLKKIITLIRPENLPSVRVAEKLGLKLIKQVDYYGFVHNYYVK